MSLTESLFSTSKQLREFAQDPKNTREYIVIRLKKNSVSADTHTTELAGRCIVVCGYDILKLGLDKIYNFLETLHEAYTSYTQIEVNRIMFKKLVKIFNSDQITPEFSEDLCSLSLIYKNRYRIEAYLSFIRVLDLESGYLILQDDQIINILKTIEGIGF